MFDTSRLPLLNDKRIAIHVTSVAESALRRGHPWLFDGAIRKQSHEGQSGDLAVIFDHKREFLAIGLYDPDSPIRVKILQHQKQTTINREWFKARLQSAFTRREPLLASQTNGYRVVYGESDGLPSLILDRYNNVFVLKLYSMAWLPHLHDVLMAMTDVYPIETLILRLSRNISDPVADFGLSDGQVLIGEDTSDAIVTFQENGLTFAADVVQGHKTGYFFDQRDNRARVRDLAYGKAILDVFAYSGGFSVHAAAGGATSVLSLDVSVPALEQARINMSLNQGIPEVLACQHDILVQDAFAGLAHLKATNQSYDLVIVDPPSFAKRAEEVNRALISYERLVRLAVPLVKPGGMLVMASCSSRIHPDIFEQTVTRAIQKQLAIQYIPEFTRTSHALDHPIGFPEAEYLKCMFIQL